MFTLCIQQLRYCSRSLGINYAMRDVSKAVAYLFVFCSRSTSRASIASKGVDLRIEELKSQNRQLLEELFTLKKACEGKDDELTELKEKVRTIACRFVELSIYNTS